MPEHCLPEPDEQALATVLGEAATRIATLWASRRQAGCTPHPAAPTDIGASLPEDGCPLALLPRQLAQLLDGATPCGGDPLDLAHIPSTGNPAALIADAFASAANLQSASARLAPRAVSLERLVLRWLATFLGYGEPCGGLLTSGSSLANLTALAAARDTALPAARAHGLSALPRGRIYASRDVHACIARAASMLGLGQAGLVDVSAGLPDCIDPQRLAAAIAADRAEGRVPVAVVATAGTTATGAVDPVAQIALVARREGIWLHVDGAYGAPAAAIDPALSVALAGADSLALDLHKWLFLPYEAGVLLIREPERLAASFAFSADYLELAQGGDAAGDPMQLGPELSRGLRALRVWATFQWAGARRLRAALRHNLSLAMRFHAAVAGSAWLEPLQPPGLSVVCLRLRGSHAVDTAASDTLHRACIEGLGQSSPAFRLSTIRRGGRLVLRACFVNPRTETSHVDALVRRLEAIARNVTPVTRG